MLVEVDRGNLYRLARKRSVRGRTELAEAVSGIFRDGGAVLSDRERSHVFGILQTVIGDVETKMRRRLSILVAAAPDAPHDLISFLSNDEIEVAFPVLTRSPVLNDQDLMDVVWNRTLEHQLAVATRPGISADVSQALVQSGDERVILTLLDNKDATISRATKAYLVEQSKRVDSYQEPLLQRGDLDTDLARRMIQWVSATLRQFIVDNFEIKSADVDSMLELAAIDEVRSASAEQRQPRRSKELAELLRQRGKATPELLYLALRDGEVALFMSLLAHMSGLTENLVRRITFDPGGEALAVVCKSIGVGKGYFTSILALTRRARPEQIRTAAKTLRRALVIYERMNENAAKRMIERWRFFDDFRTSIPDTELSAPVHG